MRLDVLRAPVFLLTLAATAAGAQVADSARPSAPATKAAGPEVSGVFYLTYRYGGGPTTRSDNRFDVDRAYLTVRAPAGDRLSIRLTADVYQQRTSGPDGYYRGWTMRAKYAYADYKIGSLGPIPASVRMGMLQTTIIEHVEQFWIRGLASTAVEQSGFFSSADVGVATTATLPNKMGELYAGVYNGDGYTTRERDRFKDYGARLTLTPLANAPVLKSLAITPWYYAGARASTFATGPGTLSPIPDARQKTRYGIFSAIKEPGITLGVHYGRKLDDVESADTTVDTSPAVAELEGSLLNTFAIVKPAELGLSFLPKNLLGVIRHDFFKPDADADGFQRQIIGGLGWQLSSKATVFLDWQRTTTEGLATPADQSTFFIHGIINY